MGIFHLNAQKFYTKNAQIEFYSKAPLENIEAHNNTAACIIDQKTGQMQFSVLIKAFEFQKALMQEHFNENYMESDRFPKADFRGQIINNNEIDYNKRGTYNARVKGKLTIHGITKDVEATGTLSIADQFEISSVFTVLLSDYNISIPALVKDKISNTVKVTVTGKLSLFKE